VTADAKTKVYGDADPALTYQVTSGSLAFSDAFSGDLTRAAGENVGNYAIGQGTLTLGSNYDLTFLGADLTITARPIQVTADAKSKVYGDADPALTYQVTSGSLAFSDAFSGALTRAAGENVGAHAIQQGSLALSTNYTLIFVGANLTINPRKVTVTADAKTKVYGDADPALTYQVTSGSLAFSDAFSGALTRAAGENVGAHAIQQGSLALSTNYTLIFVGANLTINPRKVTVTADAKTKVYGDTDPALTYKITDGSLAFSDSFSGALTRAAGVDVGTYAIQQGTLALSSNYTLTFVGANLTITARPITVTADNKTKVLGDSDPALTYQITSGSLVTGDSFSGALTRAAGEAVGTYAIQQGTLALSSNYTLTYVGANLTILYNFTGFLPPVIDHKPFKLGSTVPVKFQLMDVNGNLVSTALAKLTLHKLNGTVPEEVEIIATSTSGADTGNTFRYTDDHYHFNLSTKGNFYSQGTYRLYVSLDDGTTPNIDISFKK